MRGINVKFGRMECVWFAYGKRMAKCMVKGRVGVAYGLTTR